MRLLVECPADHMRDVTGYSAQYVFVPAKPLSRTTLFGNIVISVWKLCTVDIVSNAVS